MLGENECEGWECEWKRLKKNLSCREKAKIVFQDFTATVANILTFLGLLLIL